MTKTGTLSAEPIEAEPAGRRDRCDDLARQARQPIAEIQARESALKMTIAQIFACFTTAVIPRQFQLHLFDNSI